ncbi:putative DNA binding domain-containing protein [Candidatus Woesearchaeota archaeon]|nr:putative DNA binding domain-containing protein [Candidatus Woesearchaeota archaeon]
MNKKTFKETELLELKKSTSELKEAIISMASILNKHQKGEIYFGIKNNGEIAGQDISGKTIREVSKSVSDNIEPKIYPKIKDVLIDGRKCVHVEFNGNDIPYYAFGRAYMRVGDEDKKVSAKELEKMIVEKNKDELAWDKAVCKGAKTSDISLQKLKVFLKQAALKFDSAENSLKKLNLIKGSSLINSALILFAKNPEKFFPNAKLRCAVFGTDDASFIIDMQEFEGDLFYLIEKAQEYILKNIHIGMRIDGLYRVDVPEIDKEAFREAIVNAFCHRDYHNYDSVNIAIFRGRMEIRSPGLLYGGLTIEKIISGAVSERRNEIIAEMFHKVHFVEKWGRGINLILSKEPDADFKESGRHFVVVFKRKEKSYEVKSSEKSSEKSSVKILELIRENQSITVREIAKELNITARAVEKSISKLKLKGLLKRIGPDKGGRWEIIK